MDVKHHVYSTRYSWNWRVKARGRSTYSTSLLLELPSLLTSGLSFSAIQNSGLSLAGGHGSAVWNVSRCIWNGQFETDDLSRFNRTAMLMTQDPFEIRVRTSLPNHAAKMADDDVELNVLGCRVDILGTNCYQCVCMVQCCFTSTETIRLIRTGSPEQPPRLSHTSWTLAKWLLYQRLISSSSLFFTPSNALRSSHITK